MLTAYDSYSSLTLLNNSTATTNNTSSNNQINNLNNESSHQYAEHSFDESLPIQHQQQIQTQTSLTSTTSALATASNSIRQPHNNFDNVRCNMTLADDDDDETEDDDVHVSTKVRRCFGNTMCMPQNLLCFKVWLLV